jgi:hypothetical protein
MPVFLPALLFIDTVTGRQDQDAGPPEDQEVYEFFVLVSINRIMLQTRIQNNFEEF